VRGLSVTQGTKSAPVKAAPGRGAGRLLRAFLAGVLALLILRWALPGLFPAVTRALFGGGHGWLSAVVLGMALLFAPLLLFAAWLVRRTERRGRQVEQELRASIQRYSSMVATAMDAIITLDSGQRVVVFNAAAEKMFGVPAMEAIGRPLDRFLPPDARPHHAGYVHAFGKSGVTTRSMTSPAILTALRANGESFPIEATISHANSDGQILYTVILRDISARLRAEEHLKQVQRVEAIGRLAGGIAHDFNTLLSVILGYAELLMGELDEGDTRHARAFQIKSAAEAGALLTRQLLAFSRHQPVAPQVIDLRALLRSMTPMVERLLRADIELSVNHGDAPCPVKADPGQMQQLVLNLAANAADAMPRGGRISLELRAVELDAAYVQQHPSVRVGRYVMFSVGDTGTGMDRETAAHIFEPFFTTKAAGKGTGLGLATVYGIVRANNGDIWVYSEPGLGTIFKVYLPLVSEGEHAAGAPRPATAPELVRGGGETILLVEDSAALRELGRVILAREGYHVLAAEDGDAASKVAAAYPGTIHLLLTDVVMPRMRGPELAVLLLQSRPDMGVVFLSGYADLATLRPDGAAAVELVEKPYTAEALLLAVRRVLASCAQRRLPPTA
jgi:PAS domain S-box-containing protein